MLTARDQKLLRSLVRQIRFATLEQIARGWWPANDVALANVSRRLRKLEKSGWIVSAAYLARPLLSLDGPLVNWQPGDDNPRYQKVSTSLRRRWKQPAKRIRIYAASKHAKCAFVGQDRRAVKNFCQVSHDLHVTEVFLRYLTTEPAVASFWLGEDEIAPSRRHQVLPDAMLVNQAGQAIRAIEFGGSYSAERIREFHQDCAKRGLPYEVW